ncbi:hypothetical protein GCM10023336_62470 [Streptomyces similanensis]|uniref:Uncharacterized protein n=1 Tax=Streptomyces similanensis TaxID=1274988 RepID=A0ABP9LD11_9ACTN
MTSYPSTVGPVLAHPIAAAAGITAADLRARAGVGAGDGRGAGAGGASPVPGLRGLRCPGGSHPVTDRVTRGKVLAKTLRRCTARPVEAECPFRRWRVCGGVDRPESSA